MPKKIKVWKTEDITFNSFDNHNKMITKGDNGGCYRNLNHKEKIIAKRFENKKWIEFSKHQQNLNQLLKEIDKLKWGVNKTKKSNEMATAMLRHSGGVNIIQKEHNDNIKQIKEKTKELMGVK